MPAPRWIRILSCAALLTLANGTFARAGASTICSPTDDNLWWNGFALPIANKGVETAIIDGTDLIIGGWFTQVSSVPAVRVARRSGNTWSAIGAGVPLPIDALTFWNGHLVAACFSISPTPSAVPLVFEFDGTNWNPLGTMWNSGGNSPAVQSLIVHDGSLIAAGIFSQADGVSVGSVARWNGTAWEALGTGIPGSLIYALENYGTRLIVGGILTGFDGIAQWDGTGWSAVGGGLQFVSGPTTSPGQVYALRNVGGDLYASGSLTHSAGVAFTGLPRWNGTSWSSLGSSGLVRTSKTLGVYQDSLVASNGGNRISRWNGASWVSLLDQANAESSALVQWGSTLVAVGSMTFMPSAALTNGIIDYGGSSWDALVDPWTPGNMAGLDRSPPTGAVNWHGQLIVGGPFFCGAQDHFVTTSGVSSWNGSSWASVGPDIPGGGITSMTVWNDQIVVGMVTTRIGGVSARNIAKWNGSSWSALGQGLSYWVYAVTVYNGDLVAFGAFPKSGTTVVNGAARWDGSAWQPMGSGFPNPTSDRVPYAGIQYGTDLIATGEFSVAGGVAVSNIARWDGSAWHALDLGINGKGYAVAVFNGDLIVGGEFTQAGGIAAAGVARWNGSVWSAMGNNAIEIQALRVVNGRLYGAGEFSCDGGEVRGLAWWNGSSWTLLGSGFGPAAFHFVEEFQGDLYVGGDFGWANGRPSFNIARWMGLALVDVPAGGAQVALSLSGPRPNPSAGAFSFDFALPAATHARLAIFDISGRRVATLVDGALPAGAQRAKWSGRDDAGRVCHAGLYLARLDSPLGARSVKLVLSP